MAASPSIQVAKLRPPRLKAIMPMYATDDRYTDDVHYLGGCMTASEMAQYAVSQVAMNAMPPQAEYARRATGPTQWKARLEQTPPWLLAWLREQTDGPYWRSGSLAPDYERDQLRDVPYRRLGRRLHQPGAAHAGAVRQRAAQGR